MLQQELLTADEILSKMFADSVHVVSNRHNFLDTKGFSRDFPLLTLPVRTNLFIPFLMWASNNVSWIIKLWYLPLLISGYRIYTLFFRKSHCDNKTTLCLVQQNKPFWQSSLPRTITKFSYATTKNFENDCVVVLTLDQRELL